jgi:hypothetical protein
MVQWLNYSITQLLNFSMAQWFNFSIAHLSFLTRSPLTSHFSPLKPLTRSPLVSRMKPLQCFPQVFPVKMGVYFGGGYAFVAQHFLYGAQVGATLYQVRSKAVPEGMRRNGFGDTCCNSQVLNNVKNHYPAQPSAVFI